MSKEFEISRLLELTEKNKYATTVAAFEVIDLLDQIDIPKKMITRKPAIQAMHALSEQAVAWDYISDEQRRALDEELNPVPDGVDPGSIFNTSGSAAPISDESDEDLDEDVETAPPEALPYDEDEFGDSSDDDDSDDDTDDDDDDSDDDSDDDNSDDDDSDDDSDSEPVVADDDED